MATYWEEEEKKRDKMDYRNAGYSAAEKKAMAKRAAAKKIAARKVADNAKNKAQIKADMKAGRIPRPLTK